MLRIYYADGQTDGEKFIFDHVDPGKQTILLVPDQFSLQAEQDALRYCGIRREAAGSPGVDDAPTGGSSGGCGESGLGAGDSVSGSEAALLDLMVTDFSALGHKVVRETEGHEPQIIDKYGRHMLLSVLIERMSGELAVLRGRGRHGSGSELAEQMNTMISELKRYEIGPRRLAGAIEELKQEGAHAAGSYLVLKLEDMLRIYEAYEESIAGLYRDAEDYITYYADRIPDAALIRGSDVWIYGFDTFTPKNLLVIRRLLETAENVSVVMTYEEDSGEAKDGGFRICALTKGGGSGLFRLTEQVMQRLEQTAEEAGRDHRREKITGYDRRSMWEAGSGSAEEGAATEALRQRICLVQTGTFYEEAESAAAYIQSLVRDEGFRYGEIAVLCNDMDGRGRQLLRTFERWDIPAFADQKRKVLHQPVVSFLLSFTEVLSEGLRGDGIIGMIKSGLLGWSAEDEALLENYIREFRIRGSRWQKEFVWDGGVYTREQLQRLNAMRTFLVSVCDGAKEAVGRRNTAEEKIRGLIRFLQEEFRIRERIGQAVDRQVELQLMEGAAETAQIWNAICGILDQIVQVIGQEKVSNELLRETIRAGLQTLEIGLVPASRDCVLMGTLQRSRPGRIRALVVTGANAGLLPMDIADEGLLSRREKERLEAMDLEFAGRQRIAQMEEQLAIYRMFSLPQDRLYVSCSQSSDDGSMLRPSDLFQRLCILQPEVAGDLSDRDPMARVGSRKATVPYLAEALREGAAGGKAIRQDSWAQVLAWYWENDPAQAQRLLRGAQFNNRRQTLGEELADALYRGDRETLEVSASRLELFSGCPFSHFVQYGLRAQEQRLFEVGGREIGDIYHRCMMEFSRALEAAEMQTAAGEEMAASARAAAGNDMAASVQAAAAGEKSASSVPAWQTITEEQCRAQVAQILQGNTEEYREGLFSSDESNRFRMERITEICGDIAWALVNQVRQGKIRRMYFEQPFGQIRNSSAGTVSGSAADRSTERNAGGNADGTELYLPAVEVDVAGRKVRIRGIIDRLDVIDAGADQPDAIRIVDYKTGNNEIRTEDFRSGYKLQLMVYMDAALHASGHDLRVEEGSEPAQTGEDPLPGTSAETSLQPAGVFYFKIKDYQIDGDQSAGIPDPNDPGDLQRRMQKYYRMEGVVINDAALIGAMDARVDGSDKAESTVIPVKYDPKKEIFSKTSGGTLVEQDEFRQLLEETNRQVERICGELYSGRIEAVPKRESRTDRDGNRVTACRYCGFQSICGFDPSLKGCRYEDI